MKFRRYASWMRRLNFDMDPFVSDEVHRLISANLSNETLCPRLQELTWVARSYPFEHRFLSPHLTEFSFTWFYMGPPPDGVVPNLTSVIAQLQISSLRSLRIDISTARIPKGLGPIISSAILRCRPSLTTLSVLTPLSHTATQHIMRPPNLTAWDARNGPPRVYLKSRSYTRRSPSNGILFSRQPHVARPATQGRAPQAKNSLFWFVW